MAIWRCHKGSRSNLFTALYSVTSCTNTPPSLDEGGGRRCGTRGKGGFAGGVRKEDDWREWQLRRRERKERRCLSLAALVSIGDQGGGHACPAAPLAAACLGPLMTVGKITEEENHSEILAIKGRTTLLTS